MLNSPILAWGLVAVALAVAVLGVIVFGDLTQFYVQFPRELFFALWPIRFWMLAFALLSFVMGASLLWHDGSRAGVLLGAFVLLGLSIVGFVAIPYIMLVPDANQARFESHEIVGEYLSPDDDIIALEVNGEVRGYPRDWLLRPHTAGSQSDLIGDEHVVVTYCGLSHSALAFSPVIDDRPVDFGVAGQLNNNLVLFDRHTGKPIQQLYGSFGEAPGESERMQQYPTWNLSYAAFRELYPDAKLYFSPWGDGVNSLDSILDRRIGPRMLAAVTEQYTTDEPAFPTIPDPDPRLHNKEKVYGFDINGDRVAYTKEFIRKSGGQLTVSIGGEDVTIVHDRLHDFVDAFRTTGILELGTIDPRGLSSEAGKLERQPMVAEVLWMVWAYFYPGTDLNRV